VPTLRSYYATWIVDQVPPVVRPAQQRDYRRHLEGYVLPILGDVVLAELRALDVRGLQTELLKNGRPRRPGHRPRRGTPSKHVPLSPKTVKNILGGSLRAMLRQARADELLARDVFLEHQWPDVTTPEPDPFTPVERVKLLAWFATKTFRVLRGGGTPTVRRHPAYHAFFTLLFSTGMRPSEAAGLQWGDVDLAAGRLFVRRSRHLGSYGAPKTAAARRTVELFPEVVRWLRALAPLHVRPELPVFVNTRGTAIEPNALLVHWYAAQRACGIRVRGLYATKDSFVTRALQAGVTVAWLEAQTGVAYATLRRHYAKGWTSPDGPGELERFAALDPALFGVPAGDFAPGGKRVGGRLALRPRKR
jgi:integrase